MGVNTNNNSGKGTKKGGKGGGKKSGKQGCFGGARPKTPATATPGRLVIDDAQPGPSGLQAPASPPPVSVEKQINADQMQAEQLAAQQITDARKGTVLLLSCVSSCVYVAVCRCSTESLSLQRECHMMRQNVQIPTEKTTMRVSLRHTFPYIYDRNCNGSLSTAEIALNICIRQKFACFPRHKLQFHVFPFLLPDTEVEPEESPSTERLLDNLRESNMLMEVRPYFADGLPRRHLPGFLRRNKIIEKEMVNFGADCYYFMHFPPPCYTT